MFMLECDPWDRIQEWLMEAPNTKYPAIDADEQLSESEARRYSNDIELRNDSSTRERQWS